MACKTEKNDKLIATVKAKVEPTPELIELLKRYRDGLNMAIKWAVEWARAKGRLPTLSEIHKALYKTLRAMGLPPRIASDCYREALAVLKSFIAKGARGKIPVIKSLHMWLHKTAYKVEGNHLYTIGGYKARIIGTEERYKEGERREAKLVYRDGDMYLYIAVEVPKPMPVEPKGVIAVDINERYVYYGNAQWVKKVETPVEKGRGAPSQNTPSIQKGKERSGGLGEEDCQEDRGRGRGETICGGSRRLNRPKRGNKDIAKKPQREADGAGLSQTAVVDKVASRETRSSSRRSEPKRHVDHVPKMRRQNDRDGTQTHEMHSLQL